MFRNIGTEDNCLKCIFFSKKDFKQDVVKIVLCNKRGKASLQTSLSYP
ncbi:MAG: hypothetical protein JETT_2785 [Candidatus Jettenia ecosi]|uniref:Uncharacterized protein n=1 Tax=Candidatus Jettenia ecosi TaxID=2494326 RepID=A0A533QK61_9BACT|nr:MAG: hypothetical protein JETT_2785 [Candidatus Jettenia ecosi]